METRVGHHGLKAGRPDGGIGVPGLTVWEKGREIAIPAVWFSGVVWVSGCGAWWAAGLGGLVCVALCVRLAHDVHHNALRLPARVNDGLLFAVSLMVLSSMHAARGLHLAHHRDPMGENDHEGMPGRLGLGPAVLASLTAVPRLHLAALREAPRRDRAWIWGEIAGACVVLAGWVWLAVTVWPSAWGYPAGLLAGHLGSAMVAVWAVHRGATPGRPVTRTQESRVLHALTLGLMRHREHHARPWVPTCRLWMVSQAMKGEWGEREMIFPGLDRALSGQGRGRFRGYFRGLEA